MKNFKGLLLLSSVLALSTAYADENHVALIKNVTGTVTVIRAGARLPATPGFELNKSDEIVSDAGATGGVVFRDGTLLTVGSGSDLLIKDYVFQPEEAKYAFAVYLSKGSAVYSSGKIGKLAPESVSVATPKAVIGVRGTRFIVNAED
jgi:hypothetical protein